MTFIYAVIPQITDLVLIPGNSSSNLSCISTGSPPTTVTWRLRNEDHLIMRDGDVMSSNATGVVYQMTQIIRDRRAATYENILTIMETFISIHNFQGHRCTVTNILGSSTPLSLEVNGKNEYLTIKQTFMKQILKCFILTLSATILPTEFAIFGETYTLTCRVSGISGADITYKWSHPCPGTVNITTSPQLHFTSIKFSDAGKYNCTATISSNFMTSTTGEISVLSE